VRTEGDDRSHGLEARVTMEISERLSCDIGFQPMPRNVLTEELQNTTWTKLAARGVQRLALSKKVRE